MIEKWYQTVLEALEVSKQYENMFLVTREKVKIGAWSLEQAEALKTSYEAEGIVEARFFNEMGELHLFVREEGICCYEIIDQEGDDIPYLLREYEVKREKKQLIVKQYIDYDEDGQAEVTRMRFMKMI